MDLRKIVQTILERDLKKYDLQCHQMKDTEKKDTYKVYGELINTYGYQVAPGSRSMEALNYYTNETITIPLNPQISPLENSKKYFDKYGKLKRTYEALSQLTLEVKEEITHLESIQTALDIAQSEDDLAQIKEEMIESGYIRRKGSGKKVRLKAAPCIILIRMAFTYMSERTIFRTKSSPSSLLPVTTGGSTQKECPVPMSLSKVKDVN